MCPQTGVYSYSDISTGAQCGQTTSLLCFDLNVVWLLLVWHWGPDNTEIHHLQWRPLWVHLYKRGGVSSSPSAAFNWSFNSPFISVLLSSNSHGKFPATKRSAFICLQPGCSQFVRICLLQNNFLPWMETMWIRNRNTKYFTVYHLHAKGRNLSFARSIESKTELKEAAQSSERLQFNDSHNTQHL